jgi:hypothetical protein
MPNVGSSLSNRSGAVMNVLQRLEYLSPADLFVWEIVRRVDAGYPKAIVPITKAIAHAGGSGRR